jgi:hypothetical protein
MIRIVEDVGAPALVTAVDMITLETVPQYNEIASYVMTGVGYGVAALGIGGSKMQDFLLKVGIASLPLTARAIYARVKTGQGTSRVAGAARLALKNRAPVSRSYQPEFEGVTPYAF